MLKQSGTRWDKTGNGYTYHWTVLPIQNDDDSALCVHSNVHDIPAEGFYRGPGQPFAKPAHVYRSRTRVLVLQQGGWDI